MGSALSRSCAPQPMTPMIPLVPRNGLQNGSGDSLRPRDPQMARDRRDHQVRPRPDRRLVARAGSLGHRWRGHVFDPKAGQDPSVVRREDHDPRGIDHRQLDDLLARHHDLAASHGSQSVEHGSRSVERAPAREPPHQAMGRQRVGRPGGGHDGHPEVRHLSRPSRSKTVTRVMGHAGPIRRRDVGSADPRAGG